MAVRVAQAWSPRAANEAEGSADAGGPSGCRAAARNGAAPPVKLIADFLRLPARKQALALEAALGLLLARLLVGHVPMRYWRGFLDTAPESSSLPERREPPGPGGRRVRTEFPGVEQLQSGRAGDHRDAPGRLGVPQRLGSLVRKVAIRLPFRAPCLPQAMAAQWMLRRRGIGSRLVFGVRRSRTPDCTMEYHAWLVVAGECVIGAEEVETYSPLSLPAAACQRRETGTFGTLLRRGTRPRARCGRQAEE